MGERTTQAFKDMCWAKLEHRKGLVLGPVTNPPAHVIKSYQYQIEKALEPKFGDLFEPDRVTALLATHLDEYWREQRNEYHEHKPTVTITDTGFVVILGDFQIAEYNRVLSR